MASLPFCKRGDGVSMEAVVMGTRRSRNLLAEDATTEYRSLFLLHTVTKGADVNVLSACSIS